MTGSIKRNSPFLIGVAGGSGSGKTYFATALRERLGRSSCALIFQDNFYIDQSSKFDFDGGSVNFDHPDSIDFALLAECLKQIKSGKTAQIPIYEFATHTRKGHMAVEPKPVVLIDGILIFHDQAVRELFDDLIFFDTPEELRYKRRLERDVNERGRTPEGVRTQYYKHVKPMHDQFVQPSKAFAKNVIADIGEYDKILKVYLEKLGAIITEP